MKRINFIAWTSIIVIITIVIGNIQKASANHTPFFTWRIRGDVNYEQWIYDGEEPIALFEMRTLDEPSQALLYFQLVPRPITLRKIKLTPGGRNLVEGVQLFWKLNNQFITDVLDGLEIEGNGTDRLKVTFILKDNAGIATQTRTLTLTYDEAIGSYIYDFKDRVFIHDPETLDKNKSISMEYCDPWFTDCPAPSQNFLGKWKGRYRKYVYESRDGRLVAIPHHHFSHSQKSGIYLKRDGILTAVYEPDGNPAIQFMGDTAEKTVISICPWSYDVHMTYTANRDDIYRPITTHFRMFQCPDEKAQTMNNQADIPSIKPNEWSGIKELPMYERVSSFEKAVQLEKPREGDLDTWFWRPQDEDGATWDRSFGKTGSSSLKIEKDTTGISTWYSMCEGQGYYTEPWTPCKGYEITCYVKTKDIEGPGVSIGACYHIPNVPPTWPITRSERISGTKDWTKLTITLGPPQKDTSIMSIHLQQVGKGISWFDDLEVNMIR